MKNKLLFPIVLIVLFSCGSSSQNDEEKECISVKEYLKELNLYVDENCEIHEDKIELELFFKSKDGVNKIGNRPYFLDNKSNEIIAHLMVNDYYNQLIQFDSVIFLQYFLDFEESKGEVFVRGYTKDGLGSFKTKYDNEKLLAAHRYILNLGYDKYILYDIAIKKGLKQYDESYFIYDAIEDLLVPLKPQPSKVFDFIISMAILNEGYPEYKKTTLELYKLVGIQSDTIIDEPIDMYEYVRDNIDSTYQKPW